MKSMRKIFNDVKELNKLDPASNSDRLCKLIEEVGELATEVNKTTGRKKHKNTEEEIITEIVLEAADVIQNVFSVIDGFNISYDDLLIAMKIKNKKWHKKI